MNFWKISSNSLITELLNGPGDTGLLVVKAFYMGKLNTTEELRVCNKMCDQCLFTKNKIVTDARKTQILKSAKNNTDYFVCHKASFVNESVMCRGFYEANKNTHPLIVLGEHLKLTRFVDALEIMRNGINKLRGK